MTRTRVSNLQASLLLDLQVSSGCDVAAKMGYINILTSSIAVDQVELRARPCQSLLHSALRGFQYPARHLADTMIHWLARARLPPNSVKNLVSLGSARRPSFARSARFTHFRTLSTRPNTAGDLFNYTTGRWLYNDALRRAERRRVFDVEGLRHLAAKSVGREPSDVVDLSKLAEGGFNRLFLITMRDGFQLVARVPYPIMVPKYYAIASEVATMDFLRASGLPVPQVYGYSPSADNAAKTEYIFMEFVKGVKLTDVWYAFNEEETAQLLSQIVQLEAKMMSLSFPAGGSIYYRDDLKSVEAGRTPIALEDDRFCIGPDTGLYLSRRRRPRIEVDREPYLDGEAALMSSALKELAFLKQFGQPLLPFRREMRDCYKYQEQPPSTHIENLNRFLAMAPFLIPSNPTFSRFCIRHPDIRACEIILKKSLGSESGWQIASLLDWQHTSILPFFLNAGMPQGLQNHTDPVSDSLQVPSLPDNFNELDEEEQIAERELYHRRLVHFYYCTNTLKYNEPHYSAMKDRMCVLRTRLFTHAGIPWDGETVMLKDPLVLAADSWEKLTGGRVPCPVTFDAEDARESDKLYRDMRGGEDVIAELRRYLNCGMDGWVPAEIYEQAVEHCKEVKELALQQDLTQEERADIIAHWPWDDMDEEKYMW